MAGPGRKAIVTGATGFVGGALVARLWSAGWHVLGLTRDPQKARARHPQVEWLRWADVTESSCRDATAVLHLSTQYGRGDEIAAVYEANVVKPLRLLTTAARAGVDLFINTDSYFSRAPDDYPYLPDYRLSKHVFSSVAQRHLSAIPNVRLIDAILEHPYGPYEPAGKFCATVFDTFLCNAKTLDTTAGEQLRDFVHVDDVASAYVALLDGADRLAAYQRVGVGTGVATSVRDFVELVQSLSGASTRPVFGALPYRPHEIMASTGDTAMLRALGWQPSFKLRDGIEDCLIRRRACAATTVEDSR